MTYENQQGGIVESLLQLLIVVLVVPPIVCCALQVLLSAVGVIIPWAALVLVVALFCVCLGTIAIGRQQPPRTDAPPPRHPFPPIQRPRGIPDRRGGRIDH